jgi:LacI family transcriptional regulator
LQWKKSDFILSKAKKMENVTLKRIAEVLGLSISTVSRALKNHPDISVATKKRVNEIAEFLDYEPNINAINLRAKSNRVFGLIVPTISGFFYGSFIAAVEEECRLNDYRLMILQSGNDAQIESSNLSICRQNRVSGLFVCLSINTTNMAPFDKFNEADIPLIFFDKVPDGENYNKVCVADMEAAKMAAELLIEKKKKKILSIFGNRSLSITRHRLEAYNNVLLREQDVVIDVVHCSSTQEARNITKQYFSKKEKPDAVFCMSDEILIGVMKSLNELRIEIPEKAGVVSLSDGFLPTIYTPEVTYIETSGHKLGKLAFARMMNRLDGKTDPVELFINSPFINGGSL